MKKEENNNRTFDAEALACVHSVPFVPTSLCIRTVSHTQEAREKNTRLIIFPQKKKRIKQQTLSMPSHNKTTALYNNIAERKTSRNTRHIHTTWLTNKMKNEKETHLYTR